jgi:hypothetical protein
MYFTLREHRRVLRTKCWENIWTCHRGREGEREGKLKEMRESMGIFIICAVQQILLGASNQGEWYGRLYFKYHTSVPQEGMRKHHKSSRGKGSNLLLYL